MKLCVARPLFALRVMEDIGVRCVFFLKGKAVSRSCDDGIRVCSSEGKGQRGGGFVAYARQSVLTLRIVPLRWKCGSTFERWSGLTDSWQQMTFHYHFFLARARAHMQVRRLRSPNERVRVCAR